jgi:hypothetical protein
VSPPLSSLLLLLLLASSPPFIFSSSFCDFSCCSCFIRRRVSYYLFTPRHCPLLCFLHNIARKWQLQYPATID